MRTPCEPPPGSLPTAGSCTSHRMPSSPARTRLFGIRRSARAPTIVAISRAICSAPTFSGPRTTSPADFNPLPIQSSTGNRSAACALAGIAASTTSTAIATAAIAGTAARARGIDRSKGVDDLADAQHRGLDQAAMPGAEMMITAPIASFAA